MSPEKPEADQGQDPDRRRREAGRMRVSLSATRSAGAVFQRLYKCRLLRSARNDINDPRMSLRVGQPLRGWCQEENCLCASFFCKSRLGLHLARFSPFFPKPIFLGGVQRRSNLFRDSRGLAKHRNSVPGLIFRACSHGGVAPGRYMSDSCPDEQGMDSDWQTKGRGEKVMRCWNLVNETA